MPHSARRLAPALALPLLVLLGACSSSTSSDTTTTTKAPAATTPGTTSGTKPGTTTAGTTPGTTRAGTTPGTAPKAGPAKVQVITTPYGQALGQTDGKVLYTWDQDAAGASKCTSAACVEKWPPFVVADLASVTFGSGTPDAARFTVITRPDGAEQLALDGKPLHTMSADEPGDANCQGLDGWWIHTPDGAKNTATSATK